MYVLKTYFNGNTCIQYSHVQTISKPYVTKRFNHTHTHVYRYLKIKKLYWPYCTFRQNIGLLCKLCLSGHGAYVIEFLKELQNLLNSRINTARFVFKALFLDDSLSRRCLAHEKKSTRIFSNKFSFSTWEFYSQIWKQNK